MDNKKLDVYEDIKSRTNGEIYVGVVGPVRTGKSTFIKRFMDLLVIPNIEDVHMKERAIDELPQSAAGKTIMTTEPKFIPKEAAQVRLSDSSKVKIRLIDCVGYMVDGAAGHEENGTERMVRTPWDEKEIPFRKAAEIGTGKVIREHSTIGIVVTTDGSFGELQRASYEEPEKHTVNELKELGKPFVILLNSARPYAPETQSLAEKLEMEYEIPVIPVNCEQLKKEDIQKIMESVLDTFPVTQIEWNCPKWFEMLSAELPEKASVLKQIKEIMERFHRMRDATKETLCFPEEDDNMLKGCRYDSIDRSNGVIKILAEFKEAAYYQQLSNMTGQNMENEYDLIRTLKEMSGKKEEYQKVADACYDVRARGYGVVTPSFDEITIETPKVVKHGGKYGVKIKASAPSIHMIKANIEMEIAPLAGSEEQANDLKAFIEKESKENEKGIWDVNIYGKTVKQLIDEGLNNKVHNLTEESQIKLQEAIQKVVNENNGGLVCFII
ncbi:MAG: stage IV sporulation protein A [Clostridiales bacterium]|nr:stage IV sporulation protein A [Clostridiales bacterium]